MSLSTNFKRLRNKWVQQIFAGGHSAPTPRADLAVSPRLPLVELLESRQMLSATYPEIDLRGGGISIPTGSSSFATANNTDFGSADVASGMVSKTFTVYNTGAGVLNLTGSSRVKIGGTNPGDFSVTTQPAATVPATTGTSNFVIKFDPTASGARTATLTIYNDDDDENVYTFDVQGTGTVAPKADVRGNGIIIANNDTTPSTADLTDFGQVDTSGTTVVRTFTIRNTGSGVLTFTASPVVSSGTDAADFVVGSGPAGASTIAAGGSATFQVAFTPGAVGARVATITVNSDDPLKPAYVFSLKGTGFNAPEIDVTGGAGPTSITNNDATPAVLDGSDFGSIDVLSGSQANTFTINNLGLAALSLTGGSRVAISGTNAADFLVTTQPNAASVAAAGSKTFVVTFDPRAVGVRTALVTISNNDSNENPFKFTIRGTGTTSPEIDVQGRAVSIPSGGGNTTGSGDDTDFGSALVNYDTTVHTFTVKNLGSGVMSLGALPRVSSSSAEFVILTQPAATIAAGASSTFQVRFAPTASGARTGTITVNNDDSTGGESPYTFDVSGTGTTAPEIDVTGNSVSIASGDSTPSTADYTDFGNAAINGGTVLRTFTINNLGSAVLNLSGTPIVDITGSTDFTVSTQPGGTTVAAAANDTFVVTFAPTTTGPQTATISITNDDPNGNESTFTFDVQGTGTSDVEIDITGGAGPTSIADGTLATGVGNGTDFGSVNVNGTPATSTFHIDNTGSDALHLSGSPLILIDGTNAADFSVTTQPAPSVGPTTGTTTFVVTFSPSAPGARNATVTVFNDDTNESEYTFNITGTGVAVPELDVQGVDNASPTTVASIADGDATPATTDGTDFGTAVQNGGSVTHTYTIFNTGSGVMTLSGTPRVAVSGVDAADFVVTRQPPATLEPGTSATFDVTFSPATAAAEVATLTITSDDGDEGTYNFDITGTGVAEPEIDVRGNGQSIPQTVTPSKSNFTDFGKIEVNNGKITRTFTIYNLGGAVLNLSGTPIVDVTGAGAAAFTVTQPVAATVAAGATSTFNVTFDPSSAGTKIAQLVIANDDSNEAAYTINVTGQGVAAPWLELYGNALLIGNGDTDPRTADATDFDDCDVNGQTVSKTFTIKNTGSGLATLGNAGQALPKVAISGTNAADFTVTTQPAATVASANGTTTFVVRLNAAAVGARTANITVNSDDLNGAYTFAIRGNGVQAPVIAVKGNGNTIASGDTTPSLADYTDFGGVDTGTGTITRTFTILNTGSAAQSLAGAVSILNADSSAASTEFTLATPPAASVAATSGSTTFQVQFDPSAGGNRAGNVSINLGSSTYTFAISGTGLVTPEIDVKGNATSIVSGDVTPSTADFTDFGSVELAAGTQARTFSIFNTGAGVLRLTGSPRIAISGAAAADYSVVSQPTGRVAATSGTTSFQILFNPSAAGARAALVTIANDDANEGTYTFAITGTGVSVPVMAITGNGNAVADGATSGSSTNDTDFGSTDITGTFVTKTFTITNNGSGALTLSGTPKVSVGGTSAADFTVTVQPSSPVGSGGGTTTFTVKFDPTAVGTKTAIISIANNDTPRNPYDFVVTGVGTTNPEIDVTGGAGPTSIINADATPAVGDGTDFGNAELASGLVSKTFTIKNLGSGALSLSGSPIVQITGANASDFTITTQPTGTSIAAAGTQTFVVKFDPSAAGVRTATINIANNDADEGPYHFDIQGTGVTAPVIALSSGATAIAKGAVTTSTATGTDFGSTPTNGGTATKTYTITNNGSSNLTITSIGFTGAAAADYGSTAIGAPIAPGGTATFTVTFTPSATGARAANVSIVNTDANNTPYTFAITGTGVVAPEIDVTGGAGPTSIADGDVTPAVGDGTDFGSTDILGTFVSKTYTVKNTGAGVLTLSGTPLVQITGTNAADFTVTTQPASATVAATTGTQTFVVKFDPTAVGLRTAIITVRSNDSDEATYDFAVQGTGTVAPIMDVQGGTTPTSITNGDVTPSTPDGTDYGNVEVNLGLVTKTFTIRNTGSEALNFTGNPIITLTGANAADFTIVDFPRRSVAPGATTTFQVAFDASATGARIAQVNIANDDSGHNPYTFRIQGTGVNAPSIGITGNGLSLVKGQTATGTANGTDFGQVSATSGTNSKTYTITNNGSAVLNFNGTPKVAISGTNAADFSVQGLGGFPATLAAGASTTLTIVFDPAANGVRNAVISIASDDTANNPFTFAVTGTGI